MGRLYAAIRHFAKLKKKRSGQINLKVILKRVLVSEFRVGIGSIHLVILTTWNYINYTEWSDVRVN